MTAGADVRTEVSQASARVLEALSRGRRTAWELKMELKLSHTVLHMALGQLLERGKVALKADKLTYLVEPQGIAPQPPVLTA